MKKILVLLVMLMLTVTLAYAATDSGNISVTATIAAGTPDAAFEIHKFLNGTTYEQGTTYTSMNFNRWTVVQKTGQSAQWVGVDQYAVYAWTNGMGKKYYIKSLATGSFVNGVNTLPLGSFACIPVYSIEDYWDPLNPTTTKQGDMPAGATLAGMFAAINAAPQTVYTSETPGSSRIIQVRYGFVPYKDDGTPPWTTGLAYAPILTSQASGTYTGVTVKVSITQ